MLDFFRIPSAAVPPAPLERFRFPPSDLRKFFSRASRIHNFPVRTAVFLAARLCRSLTRRGGHGGFDVQFVQNIGISQITADLSSGYFQFQPVK